MHSPDSMDTASLTNHENAQDEQAGQNNSHQGFDSSLGPSRFQQKRDSVFQTTGVTQGQRKVGFVRQPSPTGLRKPRQVSDLVNKFLRRSVGYPKNFCIN